MDSNKIYSKIKTILLPHLNSFTGKKKISKAHTNAEFNVDDLTERNFIRCLGNCGMIASMASLLNNRDLLDKIVPKNQSFEYNSALDKKQ